jgi:alcohol dehydrogenase class IV
MGLSRFAFPTSILFGAGARKEVAGHLAAAGWTRPLVVTDRGLAALPVFEQFAGGLGSLSHAVFSGIGGNPVRSQVMAGAEAFRAHEADSGIGIGGGAALDVAKAIAQMAGHPGDILE